MSHIGPEAVGEGLQRMSSVVLDTTSNIVTTAAAKTPGLQTIVQVLVHRLAMYVCLCKHVYVCMHACMYACMYVCMYIYMCVYVGR